MVCVKSLVIVLISDVAVVSYGYQVAMATTACFDMLKKKNLKLSKCEMNETENSKNVNTVTISFVDMH